jgi:mannose-1-phosphate guanylyltransferase
VARPVLRGCPGARLLLEPEPRNTAAAIAWAAAEAICRGDSGVLGIFPADHHIPDPVAFGRDVRQAARAAASGDHLVLLGIEPTRPDTAYGYLRVGPDRGEGPTRVQRFVEKPTAARARRMLRSGEYLWNAGMVLARPERILEETRALAPEVWDSLGDVLGDLSRGRRPRREILRKAYESVASISFDYAVLERSERVLAIRGRFAWSDLGSWDALGEQLPARDGNRVHGLESALVLDASDNILWSATGKPTVLLGVSGLIVVETPDALLVCAKDRAQDVRRVVDELARRGRTNLV